MTIFLSFSFFIAITIVTYFINNTDNFHKKTKQTNKKLRKLKAVA